MKRASWIYFALLMTLLAMGCSKGEQGLKGDKGDRGDPGIPGTSCTAAITTGGINIICGLNPPVFVRDGVDGATGGIGLPGTSCSVITLLPSHDNPTGGAQIDCGGSSAVVINGAAGAAAAAFTIVGSVDPCGPSGGHDEIFLKMASGALVALFVDNSSALTARLSYIRDGVGYTTTDTSGCNFTLATDLSGLRTITYNTSVAPGSPLFESWQTY